MRVVYAPFTYENAKPTCPVFHPILWPVVCLSQRSNCEVLLHTDVRMFEIFKTTCFCQKFQIQLLIITLNPLRLILNSSVIHIRPHIARSMHNLSFHISWNWSSRILLKEGLAKMLVCSNFIVIISLFYAHCRMEDSPINNRLNLFCASWLRLIPTNLLISLHHLTLSLLWLPLPFPWLPFCYLADHQLIISSMPLHDLPSFTSCSSTRISAMPVSFTPYCSLHAY